MRVKRTDDILPDWILGIKKAQNSTTATEIDLSLGMAKDRWTVVDDEFNRANFKDLIGKQFVNPPSYAHVTRIKEPSGEWIISARRSNGESVSFCDSATQGENMVPNSSDYARTFKSKEEAIPKMEALKAKYKGLTDWEIEEKL